MMCSCWTLSTRWKNESYLLKEQAWTPPSVPHWGNSHWKSQALETKLSPELPLGINQKSQNSWTRATQDFQGQMDMFAHPGLESALSRMASEPSIHLCLPHSIYCLLLFPWLLDPNVSIGLFLFITDFTYMSQDPSMRKQWVHKPLAPISSAAWEKLIPVLGEDRQILKPTAKIDLCIYHSSPKDGRGVLPFWAE